MRRTLGSLALAFQCALLFYLSSRTTGGPSLFPNSDKLLHFLAYAALALFAWISFTASGATKGKVKRAALWAFLFAVLYGISDEFHQSFVPGREVSIADWLADSAGAAFTTLLPAAFLDRFFKRRVS